MKIGRQVCLFYIFSRQVIGRILCGIGGQKRTGGIYEEDCQQQDAGASYFPGRGFCSVFCDLFYPLYDGRFFAAQSRERREKSILMQFLRVPDQGVPIADSLISAYRADDRAVTGDLAVFFHNPKSAPDKRIEPVDDLEDAGKIIQRRVFVLEVLQLMEKDKAYILLCQQDVHVLWDDDLWPQEAVGYRTGDAAGGVQGSLPVDLQFSYAGQVPAV